MKWDVDMIAEVEVCITVEADTEEEAREAAYQEGVPGLCAQCCGGRLVHQPNWSKSEGEYDIPESTPPDAYGNEYKAVRPSTDAED